MMGILSWMFGDRKLWEIGDHRVEEKEVSIPGTEAFGDRSGVTARRKTKYRCVDCHKEFDDRETFEDERCYKVINE